MESTDPDTTKKPRASWNAMMETYLIRLLSEYNTPPHRSQSAWSRKAWSVIHQRMKTRFPSANLTKQQIKDHEQSMKKIYRCLKTLSETSGFEWDYQSNMITASEEMWESALQTNANLKKWHKKPYPPYKALQDLYEGRFVEGKGSEAPSDHGDCSSAQAFPASPPSPGGSPGEATPGYEGMQFEEHGNQTEDPQRGEKESQSIHSARPPPSPLGCIAAPSHDHGTMKKKRNYMSDDEFIQAYGWIRRQERNLFVEAIERVKAAESRVKEDPYSISKCIFAFNELSGFTKQEMVKVTLLFKDSSNREIFMALNMEEREFWLRAMFKFQEERNLLL